MAGQYAVKKSGLIIKISGLIVRKNESIVKKNESIVRKSESVVKKNGIIVITNQIVIRNRGIIVITWNELLGYILFPLGKKPSGNDIILICYGETNGVVILLLQLAELFFQFLGELLCAGLAVEVVHVLGVGLEVVELPLVYVAIKAHEGIARCADTKVAVHLVFVGIFVIMIIEGFAMQL